MSQYQDLATKARGYGAPFVSKAIAVADRLGMADADWLLAAIAIETGNFAAVGPPWNSRNAKDNGAGIIGFTGVDGQGWERMTPTEQLDLVERYYNRFKDEFGIAKFRSPVESYEIVRGPWGLLMKPDAQVGDGKTRQWVIDTATRIFTSLGLSWTVPTFGMEGAWNVRIGTWRGIFVFSQNGDVWYASAPERSGGAVPEVGMSDRKYGHWSCDGKTLTWRFGPRDDVRRFQVSLPVPEEKWEGFIRQQGQGFFKMWRGAVEPD